VIRGRLKYHAINQAVVILFIKYVSIHPGETSKKFDPWISSSLKPFYMLAQIIMYIISISSIGLGFVALILHPRSGKRYNGPSRASW